VVKPRTRNLFSLCFIAGALLLAWAACSKTTSQVRGKQEKEKQIEVSSSVPIDPAALHQDTLPNAVKRLERVETAGDCAPRYKIGGVGSCINNAASRPETNPATLSAPATAAPVVWKASGATTESSPVFQKTNRSPIDSGQGDEDEPGRAITRSTPTLSQVIKLRASWRAEE
jgi:hypothetical protein